MSQVCLGSQWPLKNNCACFVNVFFEDDIIFYMYVILCQTDCQCHKLIGSAPLSGTFLTQDPSFGRQFKTSPWEQSIGRIEESKHIRLRISRSPYCKSSASCCMRLWAFGFKKKTSKIICQLIHFTWCDGSSHMILLGVKFFNLMFRTSC